ncbi:MAG: DNA-binding protein HU-beta [Actinomycetota bacterium]|nr:DNA-binding protein HU-beta [Actinomycetota bacterium]
MNKSELVAAIAGSADLSKADAENALNALIGSVQTAVAKGEKVVLPGFGTFAPSFRNARTGMNPQTREPLQIPASTTAKFTVGSEFKNRLNP